MIGELKIGYHLKMLSLKKFNFQKSFDKVRVFTLLQGFLVFIALTGEAIVQSSIINFSFVLQVLICFVGFNFYYHALKNLFYSYWNISVFLFVFYLFSLARNYLFSSHDIIFLLYFFSFILLLFSMYIISSPLYYPRVNWWEYDFRFRNDLEVKVDFANHIYEGRLSDLRRGAGCLELFIDIPVGDEVEMEVSILNQSFILACEVRSRREPIRGRSIIYGVKFQTSDAEGKQRLKLLVNYWKESKMLKMKSKFPQTEL